MSTSVCVWCILGPSIAIPTSLQDMRFSQYCFGGYRCLVPSSPWSRGPWNHQHRVIPKRHACYNSCLPLLSQYSAGVSFLTTWCLLPVMFPVFHVMSLFGTVFRHHKYMHKQGKAVYIILDLVNAQFCRWKQHICLKQYAAAKVYCVINGKATLWTQSI